MCEREQVTVVWWSVVERAVVVCEGDCKARTSGLAAWIGGGEEITSDAVRLVCGLPRNGLMGLFRSGTVGGAVKG